MTRFSRCRWLDLTFDAFGIYFKFESLWCSGSSAIALTSYVGLQRRNAPKCSSKTSCVFIRPMWDQIFGQQRRLRDNYYFGTATSEHGIYLQRQWSAKCEIIGSDQCSECNPALCCVCMALHSDLTLHGQWHIFGVRLQRLCSGSFVCLGQSQPGFFPVGLHTVKIRSLVLVFLIFDLITINVEK